MNCNTTHYRANSSSVPGDPTCRECDVRFACHGECPKNRFIETPDGEPGLNYLCAGFKLFFQHVDFPMKLMAGLIRRGRDAQAVMAILDQTFANVDRNDPCPCGSGRKFKQCHDQPKLRSSRKSLPAPQSRSKVVNNR